MPLETRSMADTGRDKSLIAAAIETLLSLGWVAVVEKTSGCSIAVLPSHILAAGYVSNSFEPEDHGRYMLLTD